MSKETNSAKKPRNELVASSHLLERSLLEFRDINQKAHFIALNAAIEGARMRSKLATFAIVADQIARQASKNNELSDELEKLVEKIRHQSLDAVAIRNLELSMDLIDKLDRNLFERNCDVQAWATFDVIKRAITNANEETAAAAAEQLNRLVSIYMVYADSLLLDKQGRIVSAAKASHLLGQKVTGEAWFEQTLAGQVVVSDMFVCPRLGRHVVLYCSPVVDDQGAVQGVLANHFDWEFALEMITSANYDVSTQAVVLNKNGQVIAGKRKSQILFDSYDWMRGGEYCTQGALGFSVERARNGEPIVVGFSQTKGYNAYKGKSWSALITESIGEVNFEARASVLAVREGATSDVTSIVKIAEAAEKEIASEIGSKHLLATMKEVDDLVYQINANNREVKLLAVNASIQAGLAGAEGEGFSIIANEVATLAKQSLRFVDSVNKITTSLNNAVEKASFLRLVDAAKDTMSKIDRNIFERYCDIQAWSTFSKIQESFSSGRRVDDETLQLLAKIHKIYEVYHDIYVLDLNGSLRGAAVNHSILGTSFENKEWFKQAKAGNVFFSDIYESDTLKCPVMTFASPIFDHEKNLVGVLASKFNLNFLNDILRAAIVNSQSSIYLVNHGGQVISSRENGDVLNHSYKEFGLFSAEAKGSGVMNFAQKDEKFIIGYSHSQGYNSYPGQRWCLITKSPDDARRHAVNISPAERFLQKMSRTKAS